IGEGVVPDAGAAPMGRHRHWSEEAGLVDFLCPCLYVGDDHAQSARGPASRKLAVVRLASGFIGRFRLYLELSATFDTGYRHDELAALLGCCPLGTPAAFCRAWLSRVL